jgi:hypothetical protein
MTSFTGLSYGTRVVRFGDRAATYGSLLAGLGDGHPVPLYVGSAWLPRHVVLAIEVTPDAGVRVYDPARGTLVELDREPFEAGALTTLGAWTTPWFVVAPFR